MTETKIAQAAGNVMTSHDNVHTKCADVRTKCEQVHTFPKGTTVPYVDLSSSYELVAKTHSSLILKGYSNGEGVAYLRYPNHGKHNGKRGGHRGERTTKGLSSKAKRKIRIASYLFANWNGSIANNYGGCSSFLTLTFRRIVPDDKTAKKLLDHFLQRMRRRHKNFAYIWIAEYQRGKIINGKESYRMKHGEAIHFHILTPYFIPKEEINKAWNEVVMNWAISSGKITDRQGKVWKRESYLEPNKTQYLLRPNVEAVHDASAYMNKYMSKDGAGIKGNNWGYSENLSKHFEPTFDSIQDCDPSLLRESLQTVATVKDQDNYSFTDYAGNPGIWTKDIVKLERAIKSEYRMELKQAKTNEYKQVGDTFYKLSRGIWLPVEYQPEVQVSATEVMDRLYENSRSSRGAHQF